ncbi:MAG TPA: ABC transporter ATP-binding protein [Chthonomonadales bacterium]|nr:ABC transporter ATP-binding protein [Chthonomonadales bacterium]
MPEGSQWAIELVGLRKTFLLQHQMAGSLKRAAVTLLRRRRPESREVLRGIDLRVGRGETVALIGRNGSGKSTLLSLIARVYRPSAGVVRVTGRVAPLLELGAGFHPDLTGLENLELYGALLGIPIATLRARTPEIVQFAFDTPDMLEKVDTPLRNYSDGMKMRLGFSIAVHTEPDILIVDEVLAVGDEAFQLKCLRRIADFQTEGKTILFVSHDMRVVRRVATRAVWLDGGTVRMDDGVGAVVDAYVAAAEGHTALT